MSDNKNQCVKVAVRCRPMSDGQEQKMYQNIVNVEQERGQVVVHNVKDQGQRQRIFSFDLTFGQKSIQENIFKQAALPIIESVLEGYNGTIFAYGQTGTGKTHTMEGSKTVESQRGIIPRTFEHIMKSIQGTPGLNFMVRVSMLQLYNQQIVDLLSSDRKNKLQLHQSKQKGIYVKDLSQYTVASADQMKKKLKTGSDCRHVGSTGMNSVSSRSHSLFVIRVQQQEMIQGQSKIRAGRLNLVDLAGSQRQKKTQASGSRSAQGIYINSALLTLGQVIGALTNPNPSHVPYRDSKLTRLLQQSLGGNAKTIMIANIGPASYNYDQTMSTLRYASQAKRIKNKPKINQDPKDAMIRQYQQEIQRLKKMLEGQLPPDVQVVQKKVKVKRSGNLENKLQKVRQKFQKQKQKILGQNDIAQKKQLQAKQKMIAQQHKQERMKQEQLATKLKQMKQKLLHGDKLKQQARQHQKQLFEAQRQLEQRQQAKRRMMDNMDNLAKVQQDVLNKNLSIKEQVEHRRNQLKKLNNKLKLAYQQNNDIQQFMVQQRQELQQENRSIVKELKLVNLIIEHFVPINQVAGIQHRLQFDQQFDDWVIQQKNPLPKANPGSAINLKYPVCRDSRMAVACGDDNPRFRQQNLISLDVNPIQSPTEDFNSFEISENVIENLSVVLNQNQEQQRMIAKQQRPNVYIQDPEKMNKEEVMRQRQNNTRAKSAKKMRPQSGRKVKK